jgi:amino acid transporter
VDGELRNKKKLSFVLGTTGTGTVSTVYTVYTVVGFPKTTGSPNPNYFTSFILNGIWWFVVVVFMYLQYCTTDLLYMCSKQKHMADHGHKKGRRDTRTTGT